MEQKFPFSTGNLIQNFFTGHPNHMKLIFRNFPRIQLKRDTLRHITETKHRKPILLPD